MLVIVETEGLICANLQAASTASPRSSHDWTTSGTKKRRYYKERATSHERQNPSWVSLLATRASLLNKVDRSISRVLSWTVIHLGLASPQTSSNLPGSSAGHAIGSLFGLAPGGVYPATTVASGAVRSYRTFSPLPVPTRGRNRRYLLCGTSRSHTVTSVAPRRYLAPCPVEPGLSSSGYAASDCLTDPGRSLDS